MLRRSHHLCFKSMSKGSANYGCCCCAQSCWHLSLLLHHGSEWSGGGQVVGAVVGKLEELSEEVRLAAVEAITSAAAHSLSLLSPNMQVKVRSASHSLVHHLLFSLCSHFYREAAHSQSPAALMCMPSGLKALGSLAPRETSI